MSETERTVYVGNLPEYFWDPVDVEVAQRELPPWFAVVRIAEDGETPDPTPHAHRTPITTTEEP